MTYKVLNRKSVTKGRVNVFAVRVSVDHVVTFVSLAIMTIQLASHATVLHKAARPSPVTIQADVIAYPTSLANNVRCAAPVTTAIRSAYVSIFGIRISNYLENHFITYSFSLQLRCARFGGCHL